MTAPIPGAPYQVDDIVEVVAAIDRQICDVSEHIGARGRVVRLDYDAPGCTFPTDPMLHVELAAGVVDFWREELALAPSGAPPGCPGVGQRVPYHDVRGGRAACPACGYVGAVQDDRDGSVFTFAEGHRARKGVTS